MNGVEADVGWQSSSVQCCPYPPDYSIWNMIIKLDDMNVKGIAAGT